MKAANALGFWRSLQVSKTCSKKMRTEAAEAVPALVDALADRYEPVRRDAIYALGAIGEPAVKPLIDALDSEREAFDMEPILHICDAAHGLAAIGAPAVSELITALQDGRGKRACFSSVCIRRDGTRRSGRQLMPLLRY